MSDEDAFSTYKPLDEYNKQFHFKTEDDDSINKKSSSIFSQLLEMAGWILFCEKRPNLSTFYIYNNANIGFSRICLAFFLR